MIRMEAIIRESDLDTSLEHVKKTLYVRSIEGRPSIARTIWEDGIRKKKYPSHPPRRGSET